MLYLPASRLIAPTPLRERRCTFRQRLVVISWSSGPSAASITCALRSRRRERGTEFRGRGPSGFSLEEEADDAGDEEPGVDVADSRGPCGGCR